MPATIPTVPPYCLVLTADAESGALDADLAQRALDLAGQPVRWLAPAAAFEVPVTDAALRGRMECEVAGRPVDVNIVPADPRRRAKRLLLSDMDSTVIEQELIDELADVAGLRAEIAAITLAAMRGDLDFEQSLRRRVALLAGTPASAIETVLSRVRIRPGAARLVTGMKNAGAVTALVSGGFTVFVDRIAGRLGFDRAFGNVLEIEEDRIAGRIGEPILGAPGKRGVHSRLAAENRISESDTIAVGDGANDLTMLRSAGLGVAFRAKPAVRAAMRAASHGAVIDHADLTALLHLQGLPVPPHETIAKATGGTRVRPIGGDYK
jgi:phosphoserine phosphatase